MESAAAAPRTYTSTKGPAPEITLRPFRLSDVDYLLAWMGDNRVSHYTAWDTLATREQALDYLKNTILPHPYFRAVCVDEGGRPVGYVSVRPRTGSKRCRGRASCSLAREYWGRGIAAAAARMGAVEAFREFPELERVEALVDVGNVVAQTTLEKAGFVREGVHRRFYVRKGRPWDMVRVLRPSLARRIWRVFKEQVDSDLANHVYFEADSSRSTVNGKSKEVEPDFTDEPNGFEKGGMDVSSPM